MKLINKEKFGPWAVITGASSGIGKEFARQIAASGINVVLVARRQALLEELGEELHEKFGVAYHAVSADLSQADFMEKITAVTQNLDIGLLVSNAGTGVPGEFLTIPEDVLLKIINLNAVAHMRLTHHYGKRLSERGRGGLVWVSAMGALQGIPYMANDAATKAYVTSLGQGLHVELGQQGINTTVVIPGPTDTPVIDQFGLDMSNMPVKPMSVEQCVAEGLAALEANKITHLTGRLFRIMNAIIPDTIFRSINSKMLSGGIEDGQPRLAHLGQ